jgi:hypothetical protein
MRRCGRRRGCVILIFGSMEGAVMLGRVEVVDVKAGY